LKQENKNNEYLEYNKKYLTTINGNYYFSFRYKKRVYKHSLKTKDLYRSNLLKIQLIERLKKLEEFKNSFDLDYFIKNQRINELEQKENPNEQKMCVISSIGKQEDPAIIAKIEQRILKMLIKEKEKGNIKEIQFNNQSIKRQFTSEVQQSHI